MTAEQKAHVVACLNAKVRKELEWQQRSQPEQSWIISVAREMAYRDLADIFESMPIPHDPVQKREE